MIWAAKAYGVKAVNPGGVAAWKWGKDAKQLARADRRATASVTPAQIIVAASRGSCDDLGLPHPMHLHCNNLGAPGQHHDDARDDEGAGRAAAPTWPTCSTTPTAATTGTRCARRRPQIAEYFNAHPNLTTDAGAVLFGDTVTITADGPWQHLLYKLTGRKWGNLDVENETGCGIVPYVYKDQNLVNAVQWAVGLELLLLIDDPVAGLPHDRPSQRRLLLAVSGDHPAADGRRLPQGAAREAAAEGA